MMIVPPPTLLKIPRAEPEKSSSSLTPSNRTTGLPPRILVLYVGLFPAVACVASNPFPLLSLHVPTASPSFKPLMASAFSQTFKLAIGVGLAVGVGAGVGVAVAVGVGEGVEVGVGVGVNVAVAVAVAVGVGVNVAVAVG